MYDVVHVLNVFNASAVTTTATMTAAADDDDHNVGVMNFDTL